jgi:uncharacterized protein (TIGR02147 family)
MSVFEFDDYKKFVLAMIAARPKNGRGEFLRIARAMGVHSTMVTHVFKGDYQLSPEQALALADYLGLSELEAEYFLTLVQANRAGTVRARSFYAQKIREMKEKSLSLAKRLQFENSLNETDQSTFYSSWIYAAIRLMTAIPEAQTALEISQRLGINLQRVNDALEFLVSRGLIAKQGSRFVYAEKSTYVSRDSRLASRHNLNWRLKAIERLENISAMEMSYSNPVVISIEDFPKITELIVQLIKDFQEVATPSPSESLCCLNIDWIKLT